MYYKIGHAIDPTIFYTSKNLLPYYFMGLKT